MIQVGLLALFLQVAGAQQSPDVANILKKVSDTYKAVKQYEFVVDGSEREKPGSPLSTSHMVFAFRAPGEYRMQGAMPGMMVENPGFDEVLIVHDGSTAWFYMPKMNQYSSLPASALDADAPGDLGDVNPAAVDGFMMRRFRDAADHLGESRLLREEAIEIAGAKVECYVVAVSRLEEDASFTWWIDKKRFRVLREDRADSQAVFTSIKLDEPLPDELFKFKPPAGARKIAMQQ